MPYTCVAGQKLDRSTIDHSIPKGEPTSRAVFKVCAPDARSAMTARRGVLGSCPPAHWGCYVLANLVCSCGDERGPCLLMRRSSRPLAYWHSRSPTLCCQRLPLLPPACMKQSVCHDRCCHALSDSVHLLDRRSSSLMHERLCPDACRSSRSQSRRQCRMGRRASPQPSAQHSSCTRWLPSAASGALCCVTGIIACMPLHVCCSAHTCGQHRTTLA
jgi:hypothetical protein